MTKETAVRLRRICGTALSISILIAGLCLMVQCYGIYSMGDHPFSREAVAAAFAPIRVPVWLCLGLTAAAGVLELALPPRGREPMRRQTEMVLHALRKKADLASFEQAAQVLALRSKRRLHRYIALALTAAGGIVFLVYATRDGSFHQSRINGSMIRAMAVLAACLIPALSFSLWAGYKAEVLMQQEIELLKCAPKKEAQAAASAQNWVKYAVLAFAAALLIYGFATGGTADVLTKAVNICTECVGLG